MLHNFITNTKILEESLGYKQSHKRVNSKEDKDVSIENHNMIKGYLDNYNSLFVFENITFCDYNFHELLSEDNFKLSGMFLEKMIWFTNQLTESYNSNNSDNIIYTINNADSATRAYIINSIKNHNKDKKRVKEVIQFVKDKNGLHFSLPRLAHITQKLAVAFEHHYVARFAETGAIGLH